MSSVFGVHIGPYAEWLVPEHLTVTWDNGEGRIFEGRRACVWTDELDEITSGAVGLNINGMYDPPSVVIAEEKWFRVYGYPTGTAAARRMEWSENHVEQGAVDLSGVDREAEVGWFTREFAAILASLSGYFEVPVVAIRWGCVSGHS